MTYVQYDLEQDYLVITGRAQVKPHFERRKVEDVGGRVSSFPTSPISPRPPSHILPSLLSHFHAFPFCFCPFCILEHPPLLLPPNGVLAYKLCVSLLLSFSPKSYPTTSFPCTLVCFLSHQTMSPHILSP